MDTDTVSQTVSFLSWLPQQTQVFSKLSSISDDYFVHAVIPIAICAVGVHLMFKHLFCMLWFCAKIFWSLLLYVQIRDVVVTFIEKDPLSIEYRLFGIPSGTLEFTKSLGVEVIKTRVLSALIVVCPGWFLLVKDNVTQPVEDVPPGNKEESSHDSWLTSMQNGFII